MKNCSSREKTETTVHKKHASTVITENKEGAGEQFQTHFLASSNKTQTNWIRLLDGGVGQFVK